VRKICPHIEGGWSGAIGKPPVVKLVNVSSQYVRQVRQAVGPDTLIVVRWVESEQPLDNPQVRAGQWMARHTSDMMAMADYGRDKNLAWESYNEVPDAQAVAYCAFERERVMSMHAVGLRSVVGNWSVGVPDLPTWRTYQPLLDLLQPQDLVGVHEYWSDNDDISNVWHCGRWQLVPELAGRPIVVTECGRDMVEGKGAAGWRRTCNAEQFLADLRAYDALLCQYPNVVGATVFTMGQYASQWAPFDVGQLWPQVVAEQEASVQNVVDPGTPRTPIDGARVSQAFGEHPEWYPNYSGHPGVDLACPAGSNWREWHGTPVHATIDGTALTVTDASGYGLYVYITSDICDELLAHLSGFAVGNGQDVRAGDVVGYVGYSGNCKPMGGAGTHLHWAKRPLPYQMQNGYRAYVNPLP
jgi:hypothetical protein